ncbi:DUF4291 domain-containing protein [Clostridium ljungdahlii]|uniref:DUF4291 domain-containing protein n=1 Tax=Clostridium ljungdahlii (strain ATCC 55383 / DSM 13528 / PETC) TaxID=748727 RepID=D8GSZ7_CLOLD|nr:DUF4291 domain-containing protein [Clostridium ljungdahlii]ADK14567.1 conserved hypothetical protein [Clostridium ljungdahlii DSM 13528]OAA85804.1 hypothetical protein WX45_00009 [Clostridium ljungdahlii DSM 13528]
MEKKICASYTENSIRVYQAYNNKVAEECLKLGTFGESFKMERMTWIKPSFLWMMYRCGWGKKENQERVLAIDISRNGFEEMLSNVVLSTYSEKVYKSHENWKFQLKTSNVRCQWDPERDIYGNKLDRRSIQIGLQGEMVYKYVNNLILNIEDMTNKVSKWSKDIRDKKLDFKELPVENEYYVDNLIKEKLGMSI